MKRKTSKKTTSKGKTANVQRMKMISGKAKQIRKKGEVWTHAIKRASATLKKEGKL